MSILKKIDTNLAELSFIFVFVSIFFHPFSILTLQNTNFGVVSISILIYLSFTLPQQIKAVDFKKLLQQKAVKILLLLFVILIISLIYNDVVFQHVKLIKFCSGIFLTIYIGFIFNLKSNTFSLLQKVLVPLTIIWLIIGSINFFLFKEFTFNLSRLTFLQYVGNKNSDALLLLFLLVFNMSAMGKSNLLKYPIFLGIVLTGSRAITIISIIILCFHILRRGTEKQNRYKNLLVILLVISLGSVLLLFHNKYLLTRYSETFTSDRFDISLDAFNTMLQNPILGIGYGEYHYAGKITKPDTHNLFLSFGAEIGFLGFILSFTLFLCPIYFYFKNSYKFESSTIGYNLIVILFLVSFFFNTCTIFFFWLMLGLSFNLLKNPQFNSEDSLIKT